MNDSAQMALPVELNRKQTQLAAGFVGLLAFAAYFNALSNGLVWDDPIVLGRQLRAFGSIGSVFLPPRDIPQFSPDYYRPVTTLSYLIDRAVGGSGAFPFHLSVVLYHTVASMLVFWLGCLLLGSLPAGTVAAAIGAALFAVHPIHSESVAWGAGRSDVIACGFALAGTIVYCSDRRRRPSSAALAAALIMVGAMAKETAVIVLLLTPLSDLVLPRSSSPEPARASRAERRRQTAAAENAAKPLLRLAPFLVALLFYLSLRNAALEAMVGSADPLSPAAFVNVLGALGFYLFKILVPVNQCAYISDLPLHPLQILATVVALAAIGIATWVAWQRRSPLTFLLVWTMATLAPSLAIVLKIPNAPVAERYLYIPSVGLCLLIGYGLASLYVRPSSTSRIAVFTAAALLVTGAAATARRNTVWRTNTSLWEDTAAKNTTDGLPLRSLAAARLQDGDADAAEQLFLQALQRRNNAVGQQTIYNNLGSLAMQRKRYDEAERYYRRAIDFNRTSEGLYNLGLIPLTRAMEVDSSHSPEWKQDQARQARDLLLQAAALNPHDPDTQIAIGQASQAAGDDASARTHFERALEMGLDSGTEAAIRKLLDGLR